MKLTVYPAQRSAKMRAHTATHLLHTELGQIFPETKQAGSLVDSDLLRFDFYAERLLNQQELAIIEKRINQMIYLAQEVVIEEMSIQQAAQLGAKMFFEEKYGDQVRVVQIKNTDLPLELHQDDNVDHFSAYGKMLSIELCGGTHVNNTKEIGVFTILSQEAVASGIKRITALTGPRVLEKIEYQTTLLTNLSHILDVKSSGQLIEKATKMIKEITDTKSKLEAMETQMIQTILNTAQGHKTADFDLIMQVPAEINFKTLAMLAKQKFPEQNLLFITQTGNFLILAKAGTSAKMLAQNAGLKGGGNDQQAQGRDEKVLELL